MMVAATDGNISIANFETYFFSMPATPRGGFDAGTLRRIKGSTATDQWQSGQRPGYGFSSTSRNTISSAVSLRPPGPRPAFREKELARATRDPQCAPLWAPNGNA